MKYKSTWYKKLLAVLIIAVALCFAVLTALKGEKGLALAEVCAAVLFGVLSLVSRYFGKRNYMRMLAAASERLDYADTNVLLSNPEPIAVCDSDGKIIWCNEKFIEEISGEDLGSNTPINRFTGSADLSSQDAYIKYGDKYFDISFVKFTKDHCDYTVYTFVDSTYLRKIEEEYFTSRPYAIIIEIDNIDDVRSSFRDSEKAEIKSRIEAMIDDWCDRFGSVFKRISDDRYFVVTEQIHIDEMTENRFSVIDSVRNYNFKDKNAGLTLSVGVADGKDIRDCERSARKALEMAIDRGGDQVAIFRNGAYEFIGGVLQRADTKTDTRTRSWAHRLKDTILSSSNVIICGHNCSDFDSIGAAAGIAFVAGCLKIPAYIAVDKKTTLAGRLTERLEASGYEEMFVTQRRASELMNKNTLFVLVDTHMPSFCEVPALAQKAAKTVIIDHHRRTASSSDTDCILFLHDVNFSSASEIVTEMLPYIIGDDKLPSEIAEALLAGIMLDTKNFVIRSGVGTFEAAAYLKGRGADTVSVKKLFSNTIEMNKLRNQVLLNAETYKNCAVSFVSYGAPSARVIAAQVADELLSTNNIGASFVLYSEGDGICISARSLGEINVQLIMEALGGGGHQTMAACRMNITDYNKAKELLYAEIYKLPEKEI